MRVLKNTYGVSIGFVPKVSKLSLVNKLTGSSLERKVKEIPEYLEKGTIEKLLEKPLKIDENDESFYKLRSTSFLLILISNINRALLWIRSVYYNSNKIYGFIIECKDLYVSMHLTASLDF